VTDEHLSDGEIRRNFERIDRALVDLAKSAVSQDAWNRENSHLRGAINEGDKDCRERTDAVAKTAMTAIDELKKKSQLTVGRLIAILAILATLLTGWWAAFGAAKGIH